VLHKPDKLTCYLQESRSLTRIVHEDSSRSGGVARDKREDRLVSLVYLVFLVCLVEPDRPDEPDQPSLVALFPPVSPESSEAGETTEGWRFEVQGFRNFEPRTSNSRSRLARPAPSMCEAPSRMRLPAASCGVSCEILRPVGQSLWAACRSCYPPSPRLRRVLLAFIPAAAYSAEVATSATKAESYGVFGEGE